MSRLSYSRAYYISGEDAEWLSHAIYNFDLSTEESIRCSLAGLICCFRDGHWISINPPHPLKYDEYPFEYYQGLRIKGVGWNE